MQASLNNHVVSNQKTYRAITISRCCVYDNHIQEVLYKELAMFHLGHLLRSDYRQQAGTAAQGSHCHADTDINKHTHR